ncbi:Homoserine dehydrogenase [Ascochyta rabiei]|uniref:Homoserine dehydrogenase n=1 Tax=Didymella rabiei TaxID=5454 RepID=A0A162V886_DIDRA|nr:Homoserine dehydrogenase [Ascochyta rabiei]KZM18284.1 homoserine dehydrogenase [Ascochyta rabiei]UPX14666.1 Homoserine dehydrogenase [Ascochyta rabiei]
MSPPRQVFIAVIGAGGVGKAFLHQLSGLASRLSQSPSSPYRLSLIWLSTSNKAVYHADYKSLSDWEAELETNAKPSLALPQLQDYLVKAPGKVVLVDNTSNQDVANAYPTFLNRGISIVTPNKKAFSGNLQLFNDIFAAAANGSNSSGAGGHVFHESSVGAGLPVISTLKDLLETGDEVTKIEGVFSGTMSFLFNSFQPTSGGGGRFSAEVTNAKNKGYTEPDARDDLNGLDVARKLTILARLAGLPVESPTSFPVQSLIPAELESCQSGDDFLEKLPQYDAQMDALKQEAASEGKVVRFVGSVDVPANAVKVGLEKFDATHPIAALKGSDNIIAFYTKRYGDNPLIIQGAGAGADVTAMGVTADLVKVLRLLH